ncbi:hypothetical protein GCM10022261_07830 [Brevibacterium daeguense]|uniref:DNA alkylation repair protein n=1 Tax=Brevibacterium daeguense TaxID=909936 RepID=A0ABP8EH17_9MICO|nr:DNA alkylation repair protein [Brevibacterium daeguense]
MTAQPASAVIEALREFQSDAELARVRKRLSPDEPAIGTRMDDLVTVAREHAGLELAEVRKLLDHPSYEARMAAMCILDFRARSDPDDDERRALCRVYLERHDRITTWDMVDRAAPQVVGGWFVGRDKKNLIDLAGSACPLRRRTAITAPLHFLQAGDDDDVAAGTAIARRLVSAPEPVVHKAVGIFLRRLGSRDRDQLLGFLREHASAMPRTALRLAISALDDDIRRQILRH